MRISSCTGRSPPSPSKRSSCSPCGHHSMAPLRESTHRVRLPRDRKKGKEETREEDKKNVREISLEKRGSYKAATLKLFTCF